MIMVVMIVGVGPMLVLVVYVPMSIIDFPTLSRLFIFMRMLAIHNM